MIKDTIKGPTVIIAGPGTGKTTKLIERINLIIQKNSFKGIIICTFTNKAADEILIRISQSKHYQENKNLNFLVGTIHSICFQLLSQYSLNDYHDYSVLSEQAQINFIYFNFEKLGFENSEEESRSWGLAENLAAFYNKITDEQIDINKINFKETSYSNYYSKYNLYKKLLEQNNLFDFASVQDTLYQNLKNNKEFRKNIQRDFNYFFVDEYQDVNNIQDSIFKLLTYPEYNLTVVGDRDQSIYGFRGANSEHLYNFENYFIKKNIKPERIVLNKNYRSTSNIVHASNTILRNAEYERKNLNVLTARETTSHPIVNQTFESEEDESKFICETIIKLKDQNIISSFSDIAILYKSVKYHSSNMIENLTQFNIPFQTIGSGDLLTLPLAFRVSPESFP